MGLVPTGGGVGDDGNTDAPALTRDDDGGTTDTPAPTAGRSRGIKVTASPNYASESSEVEEASPLVESDAAELVNGVRGGGNSAAVRGAVLSCAVGDLTRVVM